MKKDKCVICGKPKKKTAVLIKGPLGTGICGDCIMISNNLLQISMGVISDTPMSDDIHVKVIEDDEQLPKKNKKTLKKKCRKAMKAEVSGDVEMDENAELLPTPHMMVDYLNKHVIGQDEAKKNLAVAIYNHAKRISDDSGLIRKSNILMLGSSGCGKTLLAQNIAQILGLPFVIADATSLTEAGYVGNDVESILARLLQEADGNVELAERGIIYIDEIDKIARKSDEASSRRDVSGEGVQHALLKMIEGAQITVPTEGSRRNPFGRNITLNTENILFICGGAFEGLTMKKEEKTGAFGFNTENDSKKKSRYEKVTPDMLVKYGITPELMGRLPVIVQLHDLTEQDLVQIMTEPEEAITKEYIQLLYKDGVNLFFEDEALSEIAKAAIKKHTGARGLRTLLEEVMIDIMYDLPSRENIDEDVECIITKDYVIKKLSENAA